MVIILWLRLFTCDTKPYTQGERFLLAIILAGISIISTGILLFADVTMLMPYYNISYALGIFAGLTLLVRIINPDFPSPFR